MAFFLLIPCWGNKIFQKVKSNKKINEIDINSLWWRSKSLNSSKRKLYLITLKMFESYINISTMLSPLKCYIYPKFLEWPWFFILLISGVISSFRDCNPPYSVTSLKIRVGTVLFKFTYLPNRTFHKNLWRRVLFRIVFSTILFLYYWRNNLFHFFFLITFLILLFYNT